MDSYVKGSTKENLKEKLLSPKDKKDQINKNQKDINLKIKADDINSNQVEYDKFVEICIKIKNNGLVKVISIESNVGIYNNTNFASKLCFFNTKVFNINQIFNNGTIDLTKCSGVLKCNPHVGINIPLNYMTEPHLVFLSVNLFF